MHEQRSADARGAGVQKERDASIVANEFLMAAPGLYVGGDIARYTYHYTQASVTTTIRFACYA